MNIVQYIKKYNDIKGKTWEIFSFYDLIVETNFG